MKGEILPHLCMPMNREYIQRSKPPSEPRVNRKDLYRQPGMMILYPRNLMCGQHSLGVCYLTVLVENL